MSAEEPKSDAEQPETGKDEFVFTASAYCPVVVERVNEDGTEWGVGFGHFNPEEKDYVAVKSREEAFKLHAIVSAILTNCTGPNPEARSTQVPK